MLAGGVASIRPELVNGPDSTEVVLVEPLWWKRVSMLVGFFLIWLFGGGVAAVLMQTTGDDPPWFFALWLLIWGGVGLMFLYGMVWRTFGRQSLIASADRLTIRRRLLLLRQDMTLEAGAIRSIKWVADDPTYQVTRNGRRIPQPAIRIVAADRNLSCARGIGESEARTTIAALEQRLAVARRRR